MQKNFFLAFVVSAVIVVCSVYYLMMPSAENEKLSGSFSDLPKEVQKEYVKRENIKSIDEEKITPSSLPIEGSYKELKVQIQELRKKNQTLYKQNVELANKSWKLATELQEIKDDIKNEKEQLKAKNFENINEAERQHYKNINDLTKRINILQQEAIESTQKYETQIIALENQLEELKHVLQDKELSINKKINESTEKERINNSNLAEKNHNLLNQIELMKEQMKKLYEKSSKELKLKKDEIVALKKELNIVDANTNALLTKHTNEVLDINQKNTAVLKKLRQSMENIQQEHKKEIAEKNEKIASLVADKQKEIDSLKSSYEKDGSKLYNALIDAQKNEKLYQESIDKLKNEKQELVQTIAMLQEKLKSIEDETKGIIAKKDKEYALMLEDIKRKTSQANISYAKSKEQFEKNEQRHAQNYQTLNTQIKALKNQREEFVIDAKKMMDKLEAQMKAKEQESNKTIASLKDEIEKYQEKTKDFVKLKEQDEENQNLKEEVKQKSQMLITLKSDIDSLTKELESKDKALKENKELKKVQKSLEHSLARISSLEDDVETLTQEKESIKEQNRAFQAKNTQDMDEKLQKALKEVKNRELDIKDLESTIALLEEKNLKLQESSSMQEPYIKEIQELNETLQSKENELLSLKGDLAILEEKNSELAAENETLGQQEGVPKHSQKEFDGLRNDLFNRKAEIMALKNEFDSLVKTNMELKKQLKDNASGKLADTNSNEKIASLEEGLKILANENIELRKQLENNTSNESVDMNNIEKIASLEEELKTLENENIELSQALQKVQKSSENSTQNKTKTIAKNSLKGSVTCDDMPIGTNTPTKRCEERVRKFLKRYGTGHLFEIVPIVDNGGFASLKKVEDSSLDIPKSEIERLTRLSNLGIGRDRATSGGVLVQKILGDNAVVSYATINKDIKKKRGFVINAYK